MRGGWHLKARSPGLARGIPSEGGWKQDFCYFQNTHRGKGGKGEEGEGRWDRFLGVARNEGHLSGTKNGMAWAEQASSHGWTTCPLPPPVPPPGTDSRKNRYSCVLGFLMSFSCLQDPHCMQALPCRRNEWTQACRLTQHDCVLAGLQAEKLFCSLISPFALQLAPSSPPRVLFLSSGTAAAQCGPL